MGLDDDGLDGLLDGAFAGRRAGSVLDRIAALHGAGSSILLREEEGDASPVLLRRKDVHTPQDDGRYQVLGEIARGGIGIVYKGRDKDLGREVALKVLRTEYGRREDVVQRFLEEAQIGGQLQHPGVVPVYGLGLQPDGRPCFAMKLIKGRTLAELIDSNPRGVDLLSVFEQIAQTMAYAHSRGVIHRDLKPANVMVGAFGEVQVVDWGFAKVLGQEEVQAAADRTVIATVRSGPVGSQSIAGSVMGTPAYMPPEQALGHVEDLDERSDVFALGAILCEILTGRPPYTGEPKVQIVAAAQCRLEGAHARLDAAEAADELKRLARDCMEPLADDRPASARVVAERLSAYLAGLEVRAREAEVAAVAAEHEATRQRKGRLRALALAAAVFVLIAVGAGSYGVWNHEREAREARAAPLVAAALREATRHEGEGDWAAAAAAARRAVDVADAEGVEGEAARRTLRRLVRAADQQALLGELDAIRARRGASGVGTSHGRWSIAPEGGALPARPEPRTGVGDARTDADYAAAFGRFASLEAAGAALEDSAFAGAFATHAEFWCYVRKVKLGASPDAWRPIAALSRRLDPSHAEVRAALQSGDAQFLRALVASERDDLPPGLVAQIGVLLVDLGEAEVAWRWLEPQAARHPGDLWLRLRTALAATLAGHHASAVRHAEAAVALAPQHGYAHSRLGIALGGAGAWQAAERAMRRALRLAPDDLSSLLYLSHVLREEGEPEAAREACARALALAPREASVQREVAAVRLAAGDPAGAVDAYREALALAPGDAQVVLLLGNALAAQGDFERALARYREAAALDPRYAMAHNNVGWALRNLGDAQGALRAYRHAAGLDGGEVLFHANVGNLCLAREDPAGAVAAYRQALALAPGRADLHRCLGQALQQDGDVAGAVRAFRQFVALDPDSAPAHHALGFALMELDDLDGARDHLEAAVRLDPRSARAFQDLGVVLQRQGALERALEAAREATRLDPESAGGYHNVAVILRRLGRSAEAVEANRQAVARNPGGGRHHFGLAISLEEVGEQAPAREAYRRALQLGLDDDAPRWLQLGAALLRLGDPEGAATAAAKACALAPEDAACHRLLGAARLELHDDAAAAQALRKAVALAPEQAEAHNALGVALSRLGDLKGAAACFRKAIEREPRHALAHFNLGNVLSADGDDFGAVEAWRLAVVLAPDHYLAHASLGLALLHRREDAAALEVLRRAVALDPERLDTEARYNAACAALRVGGAERDHALAWLRADLELWRARLPRDPAQVAKKLAWWREDPDLAAIRDRDDLSEEARALWADVDALLARAREASR